MTSGGININVFSIIFLKINLPNFAQAYGWHTGMILLGQEVTV